MDKTEIKKYAIKKRIRSIYNIVVVVILSYLCLEAKCARGTGKGIWLLKLFDEPTPINTIVVSVTFLVILCLFVYGRHSPARYLEEMEYAKYIRPWDRIEYEEPDMIKGKLSWFDNASLIKTYEVFRSKKEKPNFKLLCEEVVKRDIADKNRVYSELSLFTHESKSKSIFSARNGFRLSDKFFVAEHMERNAEAFIVVFFKDIESIIIVRKRKVFSIFKMDMLEVRYKITGFHYTVNIACNDLPVWVNAFKKQDFEIVDKRNP